jgi:hypothetical protein
VPLLPVLTRADDPAPPVSVCVCVREREGRASARAAGPLVGPSWASAGESSKKFYFSFSILF